MISQIWIRYKNAAVVCLTFYLIFITDPLQNFGLEGKTAEDGQIKKSAMQE